MLPVRRRAHPNDGPKFFQRHFCQSLSIIVVPRILGEDVGNVGGNNAVAGVNHRCEFYRNRVGGVARNGPAHHHDVMFFEKLSGLFNRVRHRGCHIASDVQENLLEDGGIEASSGDANFIKSVGVRDGVFCEFDPREQAGHLLRPGQCAGRFLQGGP